MTSLDLKYKQDGEEAKEIAKYLPYFPFKGIDRFYDIGGFLAEPEIFQKIVEFSKELSNFLTNRIIKMYKFCLFCETQVLSQAWLAGRQVFQRKKRRRMGVDVGRLG